MVSLLQQEDDEKDLHPNDIVFGSFKQLEYVPVQSAFSIHPPRQHRLFNEWLHTLLKIRVECGFENEVEAYEWMVLIHPRFVKFTTSFKTKTPPSFHFYGQRFSKINASVKLLYPERI